MKKDEADHDFSNKWRNDLKENPHLTPTARTEKLAKELKLKPITIARLVMRSHTILKTSPAFSTCLAF